MDTNKLITRYLDIKQVSAYDNNEWHISEIVDCDTFLRSFASFYNCLKYTYSNNGVLYYAINDYLLTFNYKFNDIKLLYERSKQYNKTNITKFIANFITSYQYSIEKEIYKESSIYEKLNYFFYGNFKRADFYRESNLNKESFVYFSEIINLMGSYFDSYFIRENLIRFHDKKTCFINYDEIIEKLLNFNKNLEIIIKYDDEKERHLEIYKLYVELLLAEDFNCINMEAAIDISLRLDKSNLLTEYIYALILNCLINRINVIIENIADVDNTIVYIANIDQCFELIRKIKKISFSNKYKDKINNIILTLKQDKRIFLKSEASYKGMQKFSVEVPIDNEKLDYLMESIKKNYQNLYFILNVNFDKVLIDSLERFSEYPINDLVTHFSFDTNKGLYTKWDGAKKDGFTDYYIKEANEYVNDHQSELINIYHDNVYLLMLRHLNQYFLLSGSLLYLRNKELFGEKFKSSICTEIYGDTADIIKNDYILACILINLIEKSIIDHLNKLSLPVEEEMQDNLAKLFNHYINDSDSRNAYMFANYLLYHSYGMNFRNDFAHGNLVDCEDLTVHIMYLYAALVGLAYLNHG